ncbi:MAG TPA: chemotaxis protein CheW [Opitutaceae bacterium]|nr:chemotaxis protein CheW [Opitutaceae bacterium]
MKAPSSSTALPSRGKFLLFTLGRHSLGIPFLQMAEVCTLDPVTPVFQPPHYDSGFLMLHGQAVPLLDLRASFGLPAPFDRHTRVIVVCHPRRLRPDELVGLVVDRVDDVLDTNPDLIRPVPGFAAVPRAHALLGTLRRGRRIHLLLDVARLFESDPVVV